MAIAAFKEAPTGHRVKLLSEGTYGIRIEFPTGEADIVVSNRFPARFRDFRLEQTYASRVETHAYSGTEATPMTPMARMVATFKASVEEGIDDYRASPIFLRSIYDVLTPKT
jgi:hypothetical protein